MPEVWPCQILFRLKTAAGTAFRRTNSVSSMRKKLEALLADGSVAGNAACQTLHKAFQNGKRSLTKAKKEKNEARVAYREAVSNDEKDQDRLFELLTAFRRAKYMHRYHRAGYQLAKYRLTGWLEAWLKNAEVPHEPAAKTGNGKQPKGKKAEIPVAKKSAGPVKTSARQKN